MALRAPIRGEVPIEGLPEPGVPHRYAAYHGGMTSHLVHRDHFEITYCGRSVMPDTPRVDWWIIEDTRSRPTICGECRNKEKALLEKRRMMKKQDLISADEYVDFHDADLDFVLAIAAEMSRQDPFGAGGIDADHRDDEANPFF